MQLNQYNRLFLSFCIVIWGTFLFSRPTFYRESFSFFLSTKLIPWYKSFFWFLYIKVLLSPPLLDCLPNLFVKHSLNLDGYLFFLCVKFSLNKFCPIAFCQQFYFCFAWKILSTGRSSYVIRSQQHVLPLTVPPESPIFFLCVKISLCSRFFPIILIVLLSLHRYISFFSSSAFFLFYRENYSYFIFNI